MEVQYKPRMCQVCLTSYVCSYEDHEGAPSHIKIRKLEKEIEELTINANTARMSRTIRELEGAKNELQDIIETIGYQLDSIVKIQKVRIKNLNKE